MQTERNQRTTASGHLQLVDGDDPVAATDEVLVQRIARKDEQAFGTLYGRYTSRLRRFVVRMTGVLGSADEIINDVMYVVWNKADTFRSGGKVSTWIFGIAHNKSLKSLEKELRTCRANLKDSLHEVDLVDPKNSFKQMETKGWLAVGLAELSPQHRATLELTYYHGMSCSEVAQVMECNENTVKTRMFYARKKLRTRLPHLAQGVVPAGGAQ